MENEWYNYPGSPISRWPKLYIGTIKENKKYIFVNSYAAAPFWCGRIYTTEEILFLEPHVGSEDDIKKYPSVFQLAEAGNIHNREREVPEEVKRIGRIVHEALNDISKRHVIVDGLIYPIIRHHNLCRCTSIGAYLFIGKIEDCRTPTPAVLRARNGERLTWIIPMIPDMDWYLIEDPK